MDAHGQGEAIVEPPLLFRKLKLGNRNPSPPSPAGWPLSWVQQAIDFPEAKLLELRGIDATLYIRFLRGCCRFQILHALVFS